MAALHRRRGGREELGPGDRIENERIDRIVAVEDAAIRQEAAGVCGVEVLGVRVPDDRPAAGVNVRAECEVLNEVRRSHQSQGFGVGASGKLGTEAPGSRGDARELVAPLWRRPGLLDYGRIQGRRGYPGADESDAR